MDVPGASKKRVDRMYVAFRVDASELIGTGHLFRCLVLADYLAHSGVRSQFILANNNPVTDRVLDSVPHAVSVLGLPAPATQAADATETLRVLHPDVAVVVVDHYQLDAQWEVAVQARVTQIAVIDDLADRPHACSLLVDPSFTHTPADYAAWLKGPAELLLGTRYAILKPEYAQFHARAPKWPSARRAHVFLGGGQAAAGLPMLVDAVLHSDPAIEVFGLGLADADAMQRIQEAHAGRMVWSPYTSQMAFEYSRCDVAIGSPGGATWERACVGLPSGVFAIAPNQVPILKQLDRAGFCRYFGEWSDFNSNSLPQVIGNLFADVRQCTALRALGLTSVDGRGTQRIADALLARVASHV
jgi:UDP-2,4-diacetamido-2,4,6-trideoxy-beta-L-altropyranose hydrolase